MIIKLKEEQGVTIVELLIGLSLLGVVLGVAYSLYFFGMTSFSRGQQQASRQQEARFISRVLSDELRYAREIEVLDVKSENFLEDDSFFYIDERGNVVKAEATKTTILAELGDYDLLSLRFATSSDEGRVVDITIGVTSNSREYELSTSVLLLNLDASSKLPTKSGTILRYRPLQKL